MYMSMHISGFFIKQILRLSQHNYHSYRRNKKRIYLGICVVHFTNNQEVHDLKFCIYNHRKRKCCCVRNRLCLQYLLSLFYLKSVGRRSKYIFWKSKYFWGPHPLVSNQIVQMNPLGSGFLYALFRCVLCLFCRGPFQAVNAAPAGS